jgi:hypothetical protein
MCRKPSSALRHFEQPAARALIDSAFETRVAQRFFTFLSSTALWRALGGPHQRWRREKLLIRVCSPRTGAFLAAARRLHLRDDGLHWKVSTPPRRGKRFDAIQSLYGAAKREIRKPADGDGDGEQNSCGRRGRFRADQRRPIGSSAINSPTAERAAFGLRGRGRSRYGNRLNGWERSSALFAFTDQPEWGEAAR